MIKLSKICKISSSNDINNKRLEFKKISTRKNLKGGQIAINPNSMIYFVNEYNRFKILQVFNVQKLLQIIRFHVDQNMNIFFHLNLSNQLISTNQHGSIIIQHSNYLQSNEISKAHQHRVERIIMNEKEDLLISGSSDKMIKFWKKENFNLHLQQVIDIDFPIYSMSVNQNQTKMIACGLQNSILMIELKQNEWVATQTIEIKEEDGQIYQISDFNIFIQYHSNSFTLREEQGNVIEQGNINFITVIVSQFIQQRHILQVQFNNSIMIYNKDEDENFLLQQLFEYKKFIKVHGQLSFDGKFLFMWDQSTLMIQSCKLKYLE